MSNIKNDRQLMETRILELLDRMISKELDQAQKGFEAHDAKKARLHTDRAAAISAALGAVEYTIDSFKQLLP